MGGWVGPRAGLDGCRKYYGPIWSESLSQPTKLMEKEYVR